jgi:hypothetical protein
MAGRVDEEGESRQSPRAAVALEDDPGRFSTGQTQSVRAVRRLRYIPEHDKADSDPWMCVF